ncbi:hypothetical protein Bca4012_089210 [Brassica carinata]
MNNTEADLELQGLAPESFVSRGRKALVWKDLRVELDSRGGRDGEMAEEDGGEEDLVETQQRASPSSGVERTMTTASRSEPRKKMRRHVEA